MTNRDQTVSGLVAFFEKRLGQEEAQAPFRTLAKAAQARQGSVKAVLAYGSCLRDGIFKDRVADLYLLVESYEAAGLSPMMQRACALLPPNVYYIECPYSDGSGESYQLRAKYALVTLAQFEALVASEKIHPYFWARFCQPIAMVYADGDETQHRLAESLAQASRTLARASAPLLDSAASSASFWQRAFAETYKTELRAEKAGRNETLYQVHQAYYDALFDALKADAVLSEAQSTKRGKARRLWWRHRQAGIFLSLLRLAKASFTFTGGPDYLAWKIERHSGVKVELSPWQKRHPILAGPWLAITLYFKGAYR